jgi:hypothetical protein
MSNYPPTAKSLFDSWLTIKLLAQAEPAFTEPAIRNHVFNAAPRQSSKGPIPGNGLAPHIRRVGSKVLISHGGFLSWIDGSGSPVGTVPIQYNPSSNIPDEKNAERTAIAQGGKAAETRRLASALETYAAQTQEAGLRSSSKQSSRRRL